MFLGLRLSEKESAVQPRANGAGRTNPGRLSNRPAAACFLPQKPSDSFFLFDFCANRCLFIFTTYIFCALILAHMWFWSAAVTHLMGVGT